MLARVAQLSCSDAGAARVGLGNYELSGIVEGRSDTQVSGLLVHARIQTFPAPNLQ